MASSRRFGPGPAYVWYSASTVNSQTSVTGTDADPLVSATFSRGDSIIGDVTQYQGTISRLTIDGPGLDLPVFLPQVQLGQSNPNLTVYSITLQLNATYTPVGPALNFISTPVQTFIVWIPQNSDARVALAPTTRQDISSSYYYARDISHVISLFNTAIATSRAAIQVQFDAWWVLNGGVPPAPALFTVAPVITYSSTTGLFTILGDVRGYGGSDRTSAGATPTEDWSLFFNTPSYALFAGIPVIRQGGSEATNSGQTYEVIFENINGTNIVGTRDPTVSASNAAAFILPNYFACVQDYVSTDSMWSPIETILMSANGLTNQSEYADPPVDLNPASAPPGSGLPTQTAPILIDINLPIERCTDVSSRIVFTPEPDWRWFSLSTSPGEIRMINTSFFWKHRITGQLIPMQMYPGSSVSVKFMFAEKPRSPAFVEMSKGGRV